MDGGGDGGLYLDFEMQVHVVRVFHPRSMCFDSEHRPPRRHHCGPLHRMFACVQGPENPLAVKTDEWGGLFLTFMGYLWTPEIRTQNQTRLLRRHEQHNYVQRAAEHHVSNSNFLEQFGVVFRVVVAATGFSNKNHKIGSFFFFFLTSEKRYLPNSRDP
jgi:hypothetical protein